jgi:GMC oxidoreductase
MPTKICIIGCGTYGAYLTRGLVEKFGNDIELTVIEMGNEKTKSESEMGVTAESSASQAAEKGRYFGLGGTSARWGGQVLFFDARDNPKNEADWQTIVDVNNQYKDRVLQNLLGDTVKIDSQLVDKGNEKTGIWLKYTKRNIFKSLNKTVLKPIQLIKNQRVTDFVFKNAKIEAILCQNTEGVSTRIDADIFYLTAGAIESCRLLLALNEVHNVIKSNDLGKHYGDHLSVELFKIKGHKPIIGQTNLLPTFLNGSLMTKRLIVADTHQRIGFAHPIFNKEVKVFTSIKRLLFGQQRIDFNVKDIFDGLEFLIRFGFSVVFLKKMYAHRNNWSLQLDIEQAYPNENSIDLSEKVDKYGQKAARLNWKVSADDKKAIEDIKNDLMDTLNKEGIDYTVVYDPNIEAVKIEDVYHPVGFMRLGHDENAVLDPECRVKGIDNLYHFSTAMFPSAKSINPTAAGFCFIEQHLNTVFTRTIKEKTVKSDLELA